MTASRPDALTWTALMAGWIEFAKASLAFPPVDDGLRWRRSVPAVINLQAVAFALADAGSLPVDEQALALVKAEVLIERSAADLGSAWSGHALPPSLKEIGDDARLALAAAADRFRTASAPAPPIPPPA